MIERKFIYWYKTDLSRRFSYSDQTRKRLSKSLIDVIYKTMSIIDIDDIENFFIENWISPKPTNENEELRDNNLSPLIQTEVKKHMGSLVKKGSIRLFKIYNLYFGQYGGCGGEHFEECIGPIPLEPNSSNLKLTEICDCVRKDLRRLFSHSLGYWYENDEKLENKTYVDLEKENLSAFSHSFLHLPEIITLKTAHTNPQLFFEYIKEREANSFMGLEKKLGVPSKYLKLLLNQTDNIYRATLDSYENLKFLTI